MVIVSPQDLGLFHLFRFQVAELHGLWNGGDPNHLLTGMILHVWEIPIESPYIVT